MSPGPYVLLVLWVSAAVHAEPGLASSVQLQDPALGPFLEAAASMNAEGVAVLRSGLSQRATDPAAAVRSFEKAATLLPGMADWSFLLAAESSARSGDTAAVRRYLERTEPVLARERGWRATSDAFRVAGNAAGAIHAIEVALPHLTGAPRSEALLSVGRLKAGRADRAGARVAYRSAIEAAPLSATALDAGRLLDEMPGGPADDALLVGRLFFRHSNGARGIAGFDAYLAAAALSPTERLAIRLEAARGLFDSRRYTAAEPRLRTLAAEAGAGVFAGDALVLLGRLQLRKGQIDPARATFRRALEVKPAPTTLPEALFAFADLEHDRGATEIASGLYRRLVTEFGTSEQAAEAAMRLGGLEYSAGRHESAARVFDTFRAAHTKGTRSIQAGYWAGQAWLAAGDTAAAIERLGAVAEADPASYYGLRAGESIGLRLRSTLRGSPMSDAALEAPARGATERIALLEQVGLRTEATIEADRAKRYFVSRSGGLYSLAEAYHARGRTLSAVQLGREIQRRNGTWDERLLRIIYPMPFQKEIVAAAASRGLDPFVVAGLIRQESLFDATALSPAGAIGLMQIMPPTGRDLARKDGISGFGNNMLRDPAVNIRLGTLFFADLLERNGGSLPYALAAYNAGPSRVARWRRNPEAADPDVFAERIPFAETRDYVRVVQQNARIYAALYGSDENPNARR